MKDRARIVLLIALFATFDRKAQPAPPSRRAATVEDSVRLRTFVEEQPVAVSPDGRQVAYVLSEPDLKNNRNETVLYVRDLPKMEEKKPQRDNGKVVLRTQGIRQMQWLADGQRLLVLHHPDGGQGTVVRLDLKSGGFTPASPVDLDVQGFAATPDGRRLALLVNAPDKTQVDRFASPRGVVITEEDFLLSVDARGAVKNKATLTAVVVADADGGALTVFGGKRSLSLMRPAISPNGRYVTFLALGEALPYPGAWQHAHVRGDSSNHHDAAGPLAARRRNRAQGSVDRDQPGAARTNAGPRRTHQLDRRQRVQELGLFNLPRGLRGRREVPVRDPVQVLGRYFYPRRQWRIDRQLRAAGPGQLRFRGADARRRDRPLS
jgi:dipeptidyl aminopeptidase/acylaminoacyl peptidase